LSVSHHSQQRKTGCALYPVSGWAADILSWLYEDGWKVSCFAHVLPHYPLLDSMC